MIIIRIFDPYILTVTQLHKSNIHTFMNPGHIKKIKYKIFFILSQTTKYYKWDQSINCVEANLFSILRWPIL